MSMVLALFGYFCFAVIIFVLGTLLGDIIAMRIMCHISWKESIRCGWLYFIDRFRKDNHNSHV